LTFSIKKG